MRTVGVEEELLLVDAGRSRVVPIGEAVVAESDGGPVPAVEHEFKLEQIEIGSAPATELPRLLAELTTLRAAADEAAVSRGGRIVAIATSPWKASPHATPDGRYARMIDEFGLLAREQLTCGQHVHVSVDSRDEGVAVLDRIRGWLPVLTALSSNSPFWQGQDTGYASFRSVLWGRWPTAGPTDTFGDLAGYDAQVAELIESGAALDDGMIYFDARLSAHYPTVEVRVADVCTDVRDAVLLAALVRALVDTAYQQWQDGRPGGRPAGGWPAAWSTRATAGRCRRGRWWTSWPGCWPRHCAPMATASG
ncbi:MAG: carboxylate-amine ligase [Jatrophihabitans sp.]